MDTLGDNLHVLLGLVPIRDRAGIARGTMADAAAAAANPHANGQALTRQGFDFAQPPALSLPPNMGRPDGGDVQLPDDVKAEYTAGSGGRAMSPAKPPLKQPLPEPTERVVASSPAAAPSPEVVRGSDVLMKAYEQQQRAARMQAIFQSIGGIVGHMRGENVSSGGGGVAGGPDLNSLKTIIDMRNAENQQAAALAVRKQTIEELQRSNGYSPEYAAAKYDSGEYKDDLKQDTIAKREAAKLAGTTREELLKPENVDALSKQLKQPPDVIRADIRNGKIGAKELADIASTQSQTSERDLKTGITASDFGVRADARRNPEAKAAELSARLGRPVSPGEVYDAASTDATYQEFIKQNTQGGQGEIAAKAATAAEARAKTAKTQQETALTAEEVAEFDRAKANPQAVMQLYDLSPTQAAKALADRGSWNDFKKSRSGAGAGDYSTYEAERAEALKKDPNKTFPDYAQWKQSQTPKTVETAEEKANSAALTHTATKFYDDRVKPAEAAAAEIRNSIQPSQDLWTKNLITGSGDLSDWEAKGRRIAANVLGYSDKATEDTQIFFNERRAKALEMRAKALPGALSDGDRNFLLEIAGNKEMNAETLRRLLFIQEKYARAQVIDHNEEVQRRKANNPTTWKHLEEVTVPAPGRFVQEDIAKPAGQVLLKQLYENPDNPEAHRLFDTAFGKGLSNYFLAHRS